MIQYIEYYNRGRLDRWEDRIGILNIKPISKQVRQEDFDNILKAKIEEDNKRPNDLDIVTEEDSSMLQARRLMECICVKEGMIYIFCVITKDP